MTISQADETPLTNIGLTGENRTELEIFASQLAKTQTAIRKTKGVKLPLLKDPARQEALLSGAQQHYRLIAEQELAVSYAGEWLLDNFYVVQQALRQVTEDIPNSFYDELPKLAEAPFEDYPRVYAISRKIVDWSLNPLTIEQIKTFINTYQEITPLTMGELWALPATLRAANLENLIWAVGELIEIEEAASIFEGVNPPERVADETQVANAIINLRMLATQDWKAYFESVSRVEQVLRRDPLGIYPQMNFETRNRYRHVIEGLAPNTGEDEERVAQAAISLASRAVVHDEDAQSPANHVGFYLIDEGRAQLEQAIAYQPKWQDRLLYLKQKYPTALYLGGIVLLMLLVMLPTLTVAAGMGASTLQTLGMLLLALVPASAAAVNIINWLVSRVMSPATLPKMDFGKGIPADYHTMVVIPAMLTDKEEIESLGKQLELHYLSNNDPALSFALLADYLDAPTQHTPEDEALETFAQKCIQSLNERYGNDERQPFYFFLRERRWNASEETWMGWERKRGKLVELNRLLLEPSAQTSYVVQQGDLSSLARVRYVITLDADTILPKDGANRLIGTLAHPLNRARFDEHGSVYRGYTILQPRIEVTPTAANKTWFTRIFAGDAGIDLYTLAVSDMYQDWFNEGIFTGKGIYDVAAFERSVAGRVPENTLLSHDLFEGVHGRAALVTDVVLLEDYPAYYLVHARRLHRWIRGDWQLLRWLMPRVPLENGESATNRLSALDRWKIIDNLRRSLIAPSMLLLFIVSWLFLPRTALLWTVFALLVSATPLITSTINSIIGNLSNGSWETFIPQLKTNVLRWLVSLAFLPYEALISLNAIAATLQRLARRRHLLQWTTAAHVARLFGDGMANDVVWREMQNSVILVAVVAVLVLLMNASALLFSAPLLALWLFAPAIAQRLNQSIAQPVPELSEDQQKALRMLARRTWLFFEQFVGPEDHWLPPDHFQEVPSIIAHHTSPTNIGLLLLSTLAAYDFGYIGLPELSARLQLTFENLDELERYRGHFLNWYDTRSLAPLPPSYVSTVDSGNLAGSLLALRQGLESLMHAPVMHQQRWQGLQDTLAVLEDALLTFKPADSRLKVDDLIGGLAGIRQQVIALRHNPIARTIYLIELADVTWLEITRLLVEVLESERDHVDAAQLRTLRVFVERVNHHLQNMQRDTNLLIPWLPLLIEPPALFSNPDTAPTILEVWHSLKDALSNVPRLHEISDIYNLGQMQLKELQDQLRQTINITDEVKAAREWCIQLNMMINEARDAVEGLISNFQSLIHQTETYMEAMDFKFLFDAHRKIFHIGYNVTNQQLDNSYYDLLASEARIASLFAIATGQIPQEHWLHLGRPQTRIHGTQTLLSWSGTMFEYLMPILLMRNYPGTLLDQSYTAVVEAQIDYGNQKHIPWGISESGYYAFDGNMNYQYRAFGVPSVAFKRGLAADLVMSPYAAVIALPIDPLAVTSNMDTLKQIGALGIYGFYEAIDYTTSRLTLGQEHAIVREYMSHHQGMIMLTLVNFLASNVMVERFHDDARIQSVELLLQEQIPTVVDYQYPSPEKAALVRSDQPHLNTSPWSLPANAPVPQVHYLSNGRYGVMLTSAGAGYSQWQSSALTRWRADTTLEDWGTWIYVHDQENNRLWSAGHQPISGTPDYENVVFFPHRAEFQRRDGDIFLQMDITVPPDDDLEIRRVRLTNQSDTAHRLLITSYGEIVLTQREGDARHPAFNKLFIESEYIPQVHALLFRRRPRSADEKPIHMLHMLVTEPGVESKPLYETDRARFLGRNCTAASPEAFTRDEPLSGTTGATLDPIMALGQEIELKPHDSVQIAYVTIAAESRGEVLSMARTYQVWSTLDRAFDQTRYRSEVEMRQLNVQSPDIQQFQKMLSALLYPQPALRAAPATLSANSKGQSGLWAHGISGDYPIILVRISDETQVGLMRELIQAHRYWRNRQIKVTLVVLNQRDTGYTQELYNQVHHLIVRLGSEIWINRHDGIFLLRADLLNEADQALLAASARVYLDGKNGSLAEQMQAANRTPVYLPSFFASLSADENGTSPAPPRPENLLFDNGFGGFAADGKEYVIYQQGEQTTPAPWINVIANPEFGFTVSESGGGFTWSGNSSENRLTAWRNDPVSDMPSEAIYLRDEETAQIWSPTPMPAGTDEPSIVRHGWGYSSFEHHSHGLKQTTTMFVAMDAPVKIMRVRLENASNRARRITATYYAEVVLGTMKDVTQQYIIPEFEATSQTLLFHNPYSIEFGERYTFITANKPFHGLTTDRTEFLGRMGSYKRPVALERIGLSGTVQTGADPCGVVQLHVDLQAGEAEDVFFIIGAGENRDAALNLAQKYGEIAQIETAWNEVGTFWNDTLTSVTVKTPDAAMNVLLPWVLYQALSCRIWGRSALYQSSGAFGFRDQLQDVMALVHSHPELTREQILRAARYQFEAGDVLHWWHPPSGRGVRTRFSDDLIWLPFVTAYYVSSTGDSAILQEKIPFLTGEALKPGEDERYGSYEPTSESFSLYEHCRRAINKGSTSGAHGLPLMGSGDWNDGMNRVGIHGRGESVWVGWFLYATMARFIPLSEGFGDNTQADKYRQRMEELKAALETNAWDGQWYLRAFYDDGTPIGSSQNLECQIDAIAQSWSVISKAADASRAQKAMESVMKRLVKIEDQILLLFTPPFDKTDHDPGYIKGYAPGIRENGGQYTHAAIWTVWALAEMGRGDDAEALFRVLNPIYHSETQEKAERYRVEPYVIAADVYGVAPHTGRGGWTWYTGSSGWMYRLGFEAILGLRREANTLRINPSIPKAWTSYEMTYRFGKSVYKIRVENPQGVSSGVKQVTLDGETLPDVAIPLVDEERTHEVVVTLGAG